MAAGASCSAGNLTGRHDMQTIADVPNKWVRRPVAIVCFLIALPVVMVLGALGGAALLIQAFTEAWEG